MRSLISIQMHHTSTIEEEVKKAHEWYKLVQTTTLVYIIYYITT